ncbi:MAG: hypothetical protein QOE75_329 [Solirubrobacterales bacterium]|jgi:hypothetical protein|nr:hypothetical protein [Solirubrobacterales bacterium]
MSAQQGWEIAAGGVGFPVAVVADGVTDPPRLTQWGGEADAPCSVTLSHEKDDVQVTTYPEIMWGAELAEIWKDLSAFVESSFGFAWEARESAPLDSEGIEVLETTWTRTENGYLEFRAYEARPEKEIDERRARRERAASEAKHRVVALPLAGSLVQATVVGDTDMWSAGFEASREDGPLVVLLSGRAIAVDSLKLELVDDLMAHLGSAQAEQH